MTNASTRVGNMRFTKSNNGGVTIQFEDNSHDPVEISETEWKQLNDTLGSSGSSYSGNR